MSELIYIEQQPLYLQNTSTSLSYIDETYRVRIGGGSGTGALHFSVENITGSGSITENGVFSFESYGTVYVKVYKDGSLFRQLPDGTWQNGYYIKSKTLVIELNLTQTQVHINVVQGQAYNIGEPKPEYPTNSYVTWVEGEPILPMLSTAPNIYFVNDSSDYYKPDLFHEVYSEKRIDNGITYSRNPNGSWKIKGRATADSYYNLIVSTLELPRFFKPGEEYEVIVSEVSIRLLIEWYDDGELISNTTLTSSQKITVPINASGLRLRFYIPRSNYGYNRTVEYHIYSTTTRRIITDKEGKYAISARNAVVATDGYEDTIQYGSAWLKYENTTSYGIYTSVHGSGKLSCSRNSAKPYAMVLVTITSKIDAYYKDNWENYYTPTSTSNRTIYDSWWLDVDSYQGTSISNDICVGQVPDHSYNPSGFYILDGNNNRVPFHAMDTRYEDSKGRLISGTYLFIMPISSVRIICTFGSISISADTSVYYGPYPYNDIGYGLDYDIRLLDKKYADALVFCYYARQFYFDDPSTALMQGTGSSQFYDTYQGDQYSTETSPELGSVIHYITRRDATDVLRRASHILDFAQEDSWTTYAIASNPDKYENEKGSKTNLPLHHLYTYAGYPPGLVYDEEESEGESSLEEWVTVSPNPMEFSPGPIYDDERGVITDRKISKFFSPTADLYAYSGRGSNDDYLVSARYLNGIAWNTWIGNIMGYDDNSFGQSAFLTYQEALTILWRYAKFRQFDVTTHGSDLEIDDSEYASWAQNGPLRWAISKGIITGYRAPYIDNISGTSVGENVLITPTTKVDRVEWAFMIYNFCRLYAW